MAVQVFGEMAVKTSSHRVPVFCLEELEAAVKKLNKRAVKLGIHEMSLTVTPDSRQETKYRRFTVETVEVNIVGVIPQLKGWRVVGTVSWLEGETYTQVFPDEEVPSRFVREATMRCDHCGTVRNRQETYLLKHAETGEVRQVGSTCLKDFTGWHTDPHALAGFAEEFGNLHLVIVGFADEDGWESGGQSRDLFGTEFYAACVSMSIRREGWLSRGKARDTDQTATADIALGYARDGGRIVVKHKLIDEVNEEDWERARAAIEYAQANQEDSDYIWSLRLATKASFITERTMGIVASVFVPYDRELERRAKKAAVLGDANNVHIGTVGKREDFQLTVTNIRWFDSYSYGGDPRALVTFVTAEGATVIWWTGESQVEAGGLEVGATVTLKATVKEHGEFNGVRQTVVTRGKVV